MLKRAAFIAAVLCVVCGTNDATAQSGLAWVQQHCSRCHAIGPSGNSPHTAAPPLRRIADFYDLDEFANILESGRLIATHPDMPTFKFDEATARAVTNYLRSIRE